MWRIIHRLCVILIVIVFCCGQYDCLQLYEVVKSENDPRNIEEPKIAEISKNEENIFGNFPINVTNLKYANPKNSEYEVNLKDGQYENTYDETIRPIYKRRISRQATLANGYVPLYPQVPSAPPYGYQSASHQPQWNAQGYNDSQPGYQGYKPTNNMSPYNQNPYNSNHGPYNPNHGPVNANQGSYNPNQNPYNPSQGQYNPSQGPSNPNYRPYNQSQGPYNANQGIHNNNQTNRPYNSQGSHYPSHGQHNYSQNPYNPTQRPYNQAPYNPNNGPHNPAAGLNPYGGYPSQKPLNTSNQRYPSYNHTSLPHSNSNIPSQYPGYRPVNNSHSGQPSFNNNYPGISPNSATQRSPYNYNPGQNPSQNNPNSYQYSGGTVGGPSQYPQNTNPYGQNANAYPQYPNSNPQNPNPYPQNVNLSYPQYQPYPKN